MPDKRPDRLSALIQRFRIKARVHSSIPLGRVERIGGYSSPNLFVVRRGRIRLMDRRSSELDVLDDTLMFLPRGVRPDSRFRVDPDDAEVVCASVETGGETNPITLALPESMIVRLDDANSLKAVADILLEEAFVPRCGGGAVIDRLCEVVVIRLLRHAIEAGQTKTGLLAGLAHPNLSGAIVAIHEHPEKPWHLEGLSEIAAMSRTHFANTFRTVVGVTPGEYLSSWRLLLARIEITKGAPVKTVARQVGFSGSAALSRAFARRYGISPREACGASR
jgi:AraC-like DNA-binding protein